MSYIPPTNEKDALSDQKSTSIIAKVTIIFSLILIIVGLVKWNWEIAAIGIVLLAILPIFKFLNWIEYNNAKMMDLEKKRSSDQEDKK